MRVRTLVLPVVVGMLLIGAATPASAHISSFSVEGASNECAEPPCPADWDGVFGWITCTEGERYLIVAKVLDSPSYEGKGYAKGTCTGSQQGWRADLTEERGVAVEKCPVQWSASANTKSDGTAHGSARDIFTCEPA